MTRYTVKTATAKFSEYGEVEFNKTSSGYAVSFRNSLTQVVTEAKTLTSLVEQLTYYLTERVPQGQATELTCEYVPPTNDTEDEERGSGRVDEKLNNDSQAHQAVNNVVSLSMWKNSSKPVSEVGSKSAKALQKRLAKLGIKPSNRPVAA